jgi:hypothetical protein
MAQAVRPWLLTAKTGLASVSVHVESVVEKLAQGQVFSRVLRFSLSVSFRHYYVHLSPPHEVCSSPDHQDINIPSYRRPYVRGFISGPALGWNRGKKHCLLLYMYPCSEPNSSVRDKTYISKSSAVVLEHDTHFS